ncbi:MAG: hypothetical protein ACI4J7_10745 [Ruminiclostridium sp.]
MRLKRIISATISVFAIVGTLCVTSSALTRLIPEQNEFQFSLQAYGKQAYSPTAIKQTSFGYAAVNVESGTVSSSKPIMLAVCDSSNASVSETRTVTAAIAPINISYTSSNVTTGSVLKLRGTSGSSAVSASGLWVP